MKQHGRLRFIKDSGFLYESSNALPNDLISNRPFLTLRSVHKKVLESLSAQTPMTLTTDDGNTHTLEMQPCENIEEVVVAKEKSSKKLKSKNGNSSLLKKNNKPSVSNPSKDQNIMKEPTDEMIQSWFLQMTAKLLMILVTIMILNVRVEIELSEATVQVQNDCEEKIYSNTKYDMSIRFSIPGWFYFVQKLLNE